jgi:hypothetical protein
MRKRLERLLAHSTMPAVAAVLGVALTLPSLGVGWQIDDHFHRLMFEGRWQTPGRSFSQLDIFNFIPNAPGWVHNLMDLGVLPWWSLEDLQASFWRPVAALSHWLDHALWPDSPAAMHAHSLLWYAFLVTAVALLYRRLETPAWVAGLAALLYALDDAHGLPVGWIANRNAIMAATLGVMGLLAHHRWRRDGWRPGVLFGPLALAGAILAGEVATATGAYLLAYALWLDKGRPWGRAASMAPYALVGVLWWIAYRVQGYGVWGSGNYVDPLREPLVFLTAVADHAPILLLDQWFLPPSSLVVFLTDASIRSWWLLAVAFLAVLSVFLAPLLRQSRTARFWATGMVLALVPICATIPNSRLLFFTGIGAMPLIVRFLAAGDGTGKRVLARAWGWTLFAVHLVLAPLLLPYTARSNARLTTWVDDLAASAPRDSSVENATFIILNPPIPFLAHYLQTVRLVRDEPVPRSVRVLASGVTGMSLTTLDDGRIRVAVEGGFVDGPFDQLARSQRFPFEAGDEIVLSDVDINIVSVTPTGRPAQVDFAFHLPLEDPSHRWLRFEDGVYVPFDLPAIGDTIHLPPVRLSL